MNPMGLTKSSIDSFFSWLKTIDREGFVTHIYEKKTSSDDFSTLAPFIDLEKNREILFNLAGIDFTRINQIINATQVDGKWISKDLAGRSYMMELFSWIKRSRGFDSRYHLAQGGDAEKLIYLIDDKKMASLLDLISKLAEKGPGPDKLVLKVENFDSELRPILRISELTDRAAQIKLLEPFFKTLDARLFIQGKMSSAVNVDFDSNKFTREIFQYAERRAQLDNLFEAIKQVVLSTEAARLPQ